MRGQILSLFRTDQLFSKRHGWCSPSQTERLGGVLAINELIDVKVHTQPAPGMQVEVLTGHQGGLPICFMGCYRRC